MSCRFCVHLHGHSREMQGRRIPSTRTPRSSSSCRYAARYAPASTFFLCPHKLSTKTQPPSTPKSSTTCIFFPLPSRVVVKQSPSSNTHTHTHTPSAPFGSSHTDRAIGGRSLPWRGGDPHWMKEFRKMRRSTKIPEKSEANSDNNRQRSTPRPNRTVLCIAIYFFHVNILFFILRRIYIYRYI